MGLIKCPNCNEIIDDNTYVCPKCGFIFDDGAKEPKEEWANYLIKKENKKKIINIVILFVGIALGVTFFILYGASSKQVTDENGVILTEYFWPFFLFAMLSFGLIGVGIFNCYILAHHKIMIENFDGYSVAVKKTFLEIFVYVDNKLVERKAKSYPYDTFKVSLPNNKKVSIILNVNVCTFELLDE